jgi:multidrug efflux pump subunit AcrA (membrane-fusion protein)
VLRLPSPALTYVPAGVPPTEPALPHEGRVFVLDHGRPRPVRITVGVQDPRHAEVVAGPLDEGDAVIVGEYGVPPSEAGVPRR